METIKDAQEVTARKEHICNFCGMPIKVGETYQTATYKADNLYIWKNHISCQKLAYKLNMFDYCDDGVTEEDFREAIWDYYFQNFDDTEDLDWEDIIVKVKEKLLRNQE
jgi:hypothetical protein